MKTLNKLIDLINQREKERLWEYREDLPYEIWLDECHIISRKDWFVKWLVDCDKIDWSKFWYSVEITTMKDKSFTHKKVMKRYETLLMILSVNKKPLEFLNDILK